MRMHTRFIAQKQRCNFGRFIDFETNFETNKA